MTVASAAQASERRRLQEIIAAFDQGAPVPLAELRELGTAADRGTRGLARRLLAHAGLRQAQQDAAELLAASCADLDFRHPALLLEALQHADALEQHDRVFELWLGYADAAARRGEFLPALISLLNAGSYDFRHGARHSAAPASLRRTVAIYERIAAQTARRLNLPDVPRGVRRSPPDGRLRIGHVIAQLVDGPHSPSRVMYTILRNADRARFETTLFITEALAAHTDAPLQELASDWSDRRAPHLIRTLEQDLGIPVVRPRTRQSLLAAAVDLRAQMAERRIDVAFFHGSIATPTDWLLCAWRSAPWEFDYGMGVPLFCPAVDYQFFEYPESMERLAFLCRERGVPYGSTPYGGTDMSYLDELPPLPRADVGLAPEHVVLGSIGNHLPRRMSERFCRTVAGVLRQHPRARYLVIGPGDFAAQRAWFGEDLCGGSAPVVRFCGPTGEPGRWTLLFDIYVNEYPAGGGVAVCEAMAARKPVVGMALDDSSLALVVRKYLGAENLVTPATDEAYAARLGQLIADPTARTELGARLRARYETDFDGRRWTQDVHDRIWALVRGPASAAAAPPPGD